MTGSRFGSRNLLLAVLLGGLLICSLETLLRLGTSSPDTRYTLPQYSLGYFWDTPLGWTGVVSGVPVNKDSVQFASLAGFFRDEPVPVPMEDNVYTRFAAYPLVPFILLSVIARGMRFYVVAFLLNRYGARARAIIEERLTFWVTVSLATLVVGIVAATYVF